MSSLNFPDVFSLVRIRKLRPVEAPDVHTALWSEWSLGGINALSLPSGYELVGVLLAPVAIEKPLLVLRLERNGVLTPGLFSSTPIRWIHQNLVATRNSVYVVTAQEMFEGVRHAMEELINAAAQSDNDPVLRQLFTRSPE